MDNVTLTTVPNTSNTADLNPFMTYFVPTEWSLQVGLVLMVIVFVVGVPGNALIITVQYKNKTKTSTDYLVMVMACYELFGSLVNTLIRGSRSIHPVWVLVSSTALCKFRPFAYFLVQYGSGETLCVLAVDRCIRTMFPLARWYREKHAKIISMCIFIFTLALTLPNVILLTWDPVTLQCAIYLSDLNFLGYIGQAGSIMMLVIFCTMSVSYLLIAIFLKRRLIRKLRQRKVHHMPDVSGSRQLTNHRAKSTMASALNKNSLKAHTSNSWEPTMSCNPESRSSNGGTSGTGNACETRQGSNLLNLEGRNVNKLTALMFMISVIYIASYLTMWYIYMTAPDSLGTGVLELSFSIPMLNCISNPVMFFCMSSRFRHNVLALLKNKQCCAGNSKSTHVTRLRTVSKNVE